jgi:hypothetical protein
MTSLECAQYAQALREDAKAVQKIRESRVTCDRPDRTLRINREVMGGKSRHSPVTFQVVATKTTTGTIAKIP